MKKLLFILGGLLLISTPVAVIATTNSSKGNVEEKPGHPSNPENPEEGTDPENPGEGNETENPEEGQEQKTDISSILIPEIFVYDEIPNETIQNAISELSSKAVIDIDFEILGSTDYEGQLLVKATKTSTLIKGKFLVEVVSKPPVLIDLDGKDLDYKKSKIDELAEITNTYTWTSIQRVSLIAVGMDPTNIDPGKIVVDFKDPFYAKHITNMVNQFYLFESYGQEAGEYYIGSSDEDKKLAESIYVGDKVFVEAFIPMKKLAEAVPGLFIDGQAEIIIECYEKLLELAG
ncbi:hypothetical protein [[Acholeplasma] multilocale]|uniref:hypothetical protein n=1 Tax=[Acholeplasma] multilocale TaxID=264638 RepID=UPI00047A002F|nr:hypothetical protein [[Acholeplasma] multilocale]